MTKHPTFEVEADISETLSELKSLVPKFKKLESEIKLYTKAANAFKLSEIRLYDAFDDLGRCVWEAPRRVRDMGEGIVKASTLMRKVQDKLSQPASVLETDLVEVLDEIIQESSKTQSALEKELKEGKAAFAQDLKKAEKDLHKMEKQNGKATDEHVAPEVIDQQDVVHETRAAMGDFLDSFYNKALEEERQRFLKILQKLILYSQDSIAAFVKCEDAAQDYLDRWEYSIEDLPHKGKNEASQHTSSSGSDDKSSEGVKTPLRSAHSPTVHDSIGEASNEDQDHSEPRLEAVRGDPIFSERLHHEHDQYSIDSRDIFPPDHPRKKLPAGATPLFHFSDDTHPESEFQRSALPDHYERREPRHSLEGEEFDHHDSIREDNTRPRERNNLAMRDAVHFDPDTRKSQLKGKKARKRGTRNSQYHEENDVPLEIGSHAHQQPFREADNLVDDFKEDHGKSRLSQDALPLGARINDLYVSDEDKRALQKNKKKKKRKKKKHDSSEKIKYGEVADLERLSDVGYRDKRNHARERDKYALPDDHDLRKERSPGGRHLQDSRYENDGRGRYAEPRPRRSRWDYAEPTRYIPVPGMSGREAMDPYGRKNVPAEFDRFERGRDFMRDGRRSWQHRSRFGSLSPSRMDFYMDDQYSYPERMHERRRRSPSPGERMGYGYAGRNVPPPASMLPPAHSPLLRRMDMPRNPHDNDFAVKSGFLPRKVDHRSPGRFQDPYAPGFAPPMPPPLHAEPPDLVQRGQTHPGLGMPSRSGRPTQLHPGEYRVLYAFRPTEPNQLELAVGDVIRVQGDPHDNWQFGFNTRNQRLVMFLLLLFGILERGWFPRTYLDFSNDQEAVDRLRRNRERPGPSTGGNMPFVPPPDY
eukprot:gene6178-7408_t